MIKELLENMSYVNLFTRPRRFGKTLTMSMLKNFFEVDSDSTLFDGLEISKEEELCKEYMGKFPVISISLKNVAGDTFDTAKRRLRSTLAMEAGRFPFLANSGRLSEGERQQYAKLIALDNKGEFTMTDTLMENSLLMLSRFLQKHYGQKVVILIDEYDVPLDKAYQSGYYDVMADFIRTLFGQALKTSGSLYFAVLTGCLRISKESIFTGLNNFNVYTVYDAIKEWYDGYRFGKLEIYCPWDVVSYCHALRMNPSAHPENYWVNTSSNSIIRKFIDKADGITRDEMELLISGKDIKKKIRQELTYRDLDSTIDNLWSILFTTGYLTQCGEDDDDGMTSLMIPNREIR